MDPFERRERPLLLTPEGKTCSMCGRTGGAGDRMVGGFGVVVCADCVADAHRLVTGSAEPDAADVPWKDRSQAEILETLPRIVAASRQMERFLFTWVAVARQSGISWAHIGRTLGVTRQAAWERFAKRLPDVPAADEDVAEEVVTEQ
ncbi:ClpX C4-type zinc finger protein [Nocardioides bruguierae]|uniref:ClpX C4-type zinc finger protein n=1 Tax=Nocardioides bruguierae TaxID=2945102 RepID=UPI002020DC3B|nr:ClpX C4-type zinc finger protein [Nocardioides bruguierae]MCL8025452.1 ClpX C4-type zinc finger protein [Nocardioides bruguierae]